MKSEHYLYMWSKKKLKLIFIYIKYRQTFKQEEKMREEWKHKENKW